MESYVAQSCYGSHCTKCEVFIHDGWYCVEGSQNVNHTNEDLSGFEIGSGYVLNVENLSDDDCFTWSEPIESLDQLIEAVEE